MDNILTDEQKKYIKRNLDVQTLDEIAEYLQVNSVVIANFIVTELTSDLLDPKKETLDLDFLKNIEICESPKKVQYSIAFELDDAGDVDIHMEWPDGDNSEEFVENVGVLLHMIHSGKIKSMIGQNLTRIAQDNDMEKEVLDVIRKWNALDQLDNSRPCVHPREVF
mgnify:CR=1 FL=1